MKMIKRSVVSFVLALVMIAMPIGDTYTLTPVYAETTVYVTPTGSSSSSSASKITKHSTPKVAPFKLKTTSVFLLKGKSKTIGTKNATGKVKWTSNKKSVATVSSSGTVTAKVHGKTYVCKVVVEKPKVDDFTLSRTQLNLSGNDWTLQSIYVEGIDEDLFDYYSVSEEISVENYNDEEVQNKIVI